MFTSAVNGRFTSSIWLHNMGKNMKRAFEPSVENPNRSFFVKKQSRMTSDAEGILRYLENHEFGTPPPMLSKKLSPDVFKQHYYDKNELTEFCRSIGISTTGQKNDLNSRIELYLRTGRVTVVAPVVRSTRPDSEIGLTLDKVVVNYKSDPVTRQFFERNCRGFTGFSALVQKQIKQRLADGESFTYGDVIAMHRAFLKNKQQARDTGQATTVAHDSCQFNQFYIDYSHDNSSKVHTAKEAWMLVRNTAGAKTYQRYKDRIEEIRGELSTQEASKTPSI